MKYLVLFLSIVSISNVYASAWDQRMAKGYLWYSQAEKEQALELKSTEPNPTAQQDPLEWVQEVVKKGEWLKARALRDGTESNVMEYIKHQEQQVSRANQFSQIWDHVLRKHPEHDFLIKNPATQQGRNLFLDLEKQQTKDTIKNLGKKYGLIFFFSGSCQYCHLEAPIVQQVADSYGIDVLGITLDGKHIAEIRNIQADNGIAKSLEIVSVPSIYAVDYSNNESIPIAHGLISLDDLTKRIREVVEYEKLL